jgi:DNA-binding NtrC family response regulator
VIRVGGNEKVKLDVRLIVATHKNLAEEVKKGNFREDLYFRIMGLPIELPPLRERDEDILILSKYFIESFVKENKLPPLQLTQEAKDKLLHHYFPGNVRELKTIIDLACVMCENNQIAADDIILTSLRKEDVLMGEQKTLREYTIDIVKYYLKKNNDDVIATSKMLDIGKSTIYKMKQAGDLN